MTFRSVIGARGEAAACKFLRREGYRVLARNVRNKWSELDVVCRNKRRELVFVEVKSRSVDTLTVPEEALTADKRRRLKRAAGAYVSRAGYRGPYHIDAVCMTFSANARTILHINHYRDIVT